MFGHFFRKHGTKILIAVIVAIPAIQFIPVDRSAPPTESEVPATPEVRAILKKACYDCHSNQTVWPWYSRIAPVSWLVARDVHEGREEMNYTSWNRLSPAKQSKRFKQSGELVENGEMPLWFYVPLHPEAKLTPQEKALIMEWSQAMGSPSAAL